MQHEPLGGHLNDVTRFGARQRCLKHRLVMLRIESVADLRINHGDAVFGKDIEQLAQGQLDALKERGRPGALLLTRSWICPGA